MTDSSDTLHYRLSSLEKTVRDSLERQIRTEAVVQGVQDAQRATQDGLLSLADDVKHIRQSTDDQSRKDQRLALFIRATPAIALIAPVIWHLIIGK